MELLDLVRASPLDPNGKQWNWSAISRNKSISLELILGFPDLPWDWSGVSNNPNITLSSVLNHPDLGWIYEYILCNASYTLDELLSCSYPIPLDWECISHNSNLTQADVDNHPDLPWSGSGLAKQSWMTMDYVLAHPHFFFTPYHYCKLSTNGGLKLTEILAHPQLFPDTSMMGRNPSLTEADLDNNNIHWYKTAICENSSISLDYFLRHPDKISSTLSENQGLTLQQVLRCHQFKWNYMYICYHTSKISYHDHLALIHREQNNSASYFSRLPQDMLTYYLHLYFLAWHPDYVKS